MPSEKYINITIPAQAETLTDFPLPLVLGPDRRPSSVDDDFAGDNYTKPRTDLWRTVDAPNVHLINGTVNLNTGWIQSKFTLSGDFDIEVSIDFSGSTTIGDRAGINISHVGDLGSSPTNGAVLHREIIAGPTHIIAANVKDNGSYQAGAIFSTTETNIKLRYVRTGLTVNSYYDIGSGWVLLYSDTVSEAVPWFVWLEDVSGDNKFDNFILNSGTVVWPESIPAGTGNAQVDAKLEEMFDLLTPANVDDDFTGEDGDSPNEILWSLSGAECEKYISSNSLYLKHTKVSSYQTFPLKSKYLLTGDFELELEISSFDTTGANTATALGLIFTDFTGSTFIAFSKLSGTLSAWWQLNGASQDLDIISNNYGSLKVNRTGSTLSLYYKDGAGSFVLAQSGAVSEDDIYVRFWTYISDPTGSVSALVDNFTVNSGTIVWPETPSHLKVIDKATDLQCFVEKVFWDYNNRRCQLVVNVPEINSSSGASLQLWYDPANGDNSVRSAADASDDFTGTDGDLPRKDLWVEVSDLWGNGNNANSYSEISGNEIKIGSTVANQFGGVESRYRLSGDFSIVIDVDYSNFPVGSNGFCYLWKDTNNRAAVGRNTSEGIYFGSAVSGSWTNNNISPASVNSVTQLRLTRVSGQLTCECYDNGSWRTIGTNTWSVEDFFIVLFAQPSNGTGYLLFDNFTVNSADSITGFIGDTGSVQAQQVWDKDYLGVWHFTDDPSGGVITDSTKNNNDLALYGSMTSSDLVDSAAGKSISFDGVDDYARIADLIDLGLHDLHATVEVVSSGICIFGTERTSTALGRAEFTLVSSGLFQHRREDTTTPPHYAHFLTVMDPDGELQPINYVAYSSMGASNDRIVHVNGRTSESLLDFSYSSAGFDDVEIGRAKNHTYSTTYYDSIVSEFRISSAGRSVTWIEATEQAFQGNLATLTPGLITVTATANSSYLIDTSVDQYQVDLPASPSANDYVWVADYALSFSTNNCTISGNGNRIKGSTDPLVLSQDGRSVKLTYVDATQGWLVTDGETPTGIQSISGTVDEIDVDNTDPANPVISISSSFSGAALNPLPGNTMVTGNMHGLEYAKTGDNEVTVQAGICMDSTNTVVLSASSSQTVAIPTAINTIYNLFLCDDGVVRTDTDVNGANLSAYDIRWIGFVTTNSSGNIIDFTFNGDCMIFQRASEVSIGTVVQSFTTLDHSALAPVSRIGKVLYGVQDASSGRSAWFSDDGTNISGFIGSSSGATANTSADIWGSTGASNIGLVPYTSSRQFRGSDSGGVKVLLHGLTVKR